MDDAEALLATLNDSELVKLLQNIDPNVHRGMPREALEEIYRSQYTGGLPRRPIDDYRDAIFRLVDTYWEQISPTITCPMQSRDPRACYGCPDLQVAECVNKNKTYLDRVMKGDDKHE